MSDAPETVVIPPGALASSSVRVDTWLWATRHLKSRSQATAAVRAGHVRVNGEPVKAAYKVRVGDEVRLRIEGFDRILGVVVLLNKRVSYPQARTAYDDRTPERPRVHIPVAMREKGSGRHQEGTPGAGPPARVRLSRALLTLCRGRGGPWLRCVYARSRRLVRRRDRQREYLLVGEEGLGSDLVEGAPRGVVR